LQVSCLQGVEIMGRLATADCNATDKSSLSCYLWKIQRFPIVARHEEYVLAKRWREHDHEAARHLVSSHLRVVAKIARGHRGYGLPISDLISRRAISAR
jgi:RNA polymerase sigma-32 factor